MLDKLLHWIKSIWIKLSLMERAYILVFSVFMIVIISREFSKPSETYLPKPPNHNRKPIDTTGFYAARKESKRLGKVMDSIDKHKTEKQQSEIDERFNDDYVSNANGGEKDFWYYNIDGECLAAISEDDLNELTKLAVRKDAEAVMLMVAEGKAIIIKSGTRVRKISGGLLRCKVKIMSGDNYGEELYLPCDYLKH